MTEPNTEDFVRLNNRELTVLIFALNYLTNKNEVYLQANYTDVNKLYNKLYSVWEKLESNEKIRNSIVCDV
jgi:hypothetical protein